MFKLLKKIFVPLFFALLSFFIAIVAKELQFVQNFEFPITDGLKFAYKEIDKYEKLDSDIAIVGITEASLTRYLNSVYGTYPWPRETYGNFISYFDLDIPKEIDLELFNSSINYFNQEKKDQILNLISQGYVLVDPLKEKVLKDVESNENEALDKTYNNVRNLLKKIKPEVVKTKYILKEEYYDNEEYKNAWYQAIYGITLPELKLLTWNSINPKTIFFDIFFDFPRDKESDQKFFDKLAEQKDEHFIFVDFLTGEKEKGRLPLNDDYKSRYSYIKKWQIKNLFDEKGNKIITLDQTRPMSVDIKPPLNDVVKNITGFGPANILPSKDGDRREMPLIWKVYDERVMDQPAYIPTIDFALLLDRFYNVKSQEEIAQIIDDKVEVYLGKEVLLKDAVIRKRIDYIRQSFNDPKKKYKWTQFIDPFMDYILEQIEKKNSSEIAFKDIVDNLSKDEKLINLLKEKYKENKMDLDETSKSLNTTNEEITKLEIKDFLFSLSNTSLNKQTDFFIINNKILADFDLPALKKLHKSIKDRKDVLDYLVQYDEAEDNITFLKDLSPGVEVYSGLNFDKKTLLSEISKASGVKEEDVYKTLQMLKEKKLINYAEENKTTFSFDILNAEELEKYKQSQTDAKIKGIITRYQEWRDFDLYENQILKEFYKDIFDNFKADSKLTDSVTNELIKNNWISYTKMSSDKINISIDNYKKLLDYSRTDAKITSNDKLIIENLLKISELHVKTSDTALHYFKLPYKKIIQDISSFQNGLNIVPDNISEEKLNNEILAILSEEEQKQLLQYYNKDGSAYKLNPSLTEESKQSLNKLYKKINLSVNLTNLSNALYPAKLNINGDYLEIYEPEKIIEFIKLAESNELILLSFIKQIQGLEGKKDISYNQILLSISQDIKDKAKVQPSVIGDVLQSIISFAEQGKEKKLINVKTISEDQLKIKLDKEQIKNYRVQIRTVRVPIDRYGQFKINFQGPAKTFENYNFGKHMKFTRGLAHPMTGEKNNFAWQLFKNKTLCIGFYTSAGLGEGRDYFETPYGTLYGIEIHANALYTLYEEDFIHNLSPVMGYEAEYAIMLAFALFFGLFIPRLSIFQGALFFTIVLVVYYMINIMYIFPIENLDIPLIGTTITMAVTFLALTVYRLFTEEREKRKIKGMFSKYVSPDLVNELVQADKQLELGGEDRQLTVLFSDIRGFTSLSEGLTPQDLVSHLNIYLTEMTEIVLHNKGTLDKYIGDALMAFWGAPINTADHAYLSCKAALEMMERLDELNKEWPEDKKINIGIGLNSGEMTVGNMGSTSRMDYTIMGDNVNLGSRVESVNKMYSTEVIITEYTYELVKDKVIVRELDLIRVKGKEQPVKIFELLAIK